MYVQCQECGLSFEDINVSYRCPHKGLRHCVVCDCVVCTCSDDTTNPRSNKYIDPEVLKAEQNEENVLEGLLPPSKVTSGSLATDIGYILSSDEFRMTMSFGLNKMKEEIITRVLGRELKERGWEELAIVEGIKETIRKNRK